MITVEAYDSCFRQEWDDFVEVSKNGTFMLKRGYVEYHADRFADFSLMFYDDGQLVAVLPASRHGDEIRSHGGLTYGGIICGRQMAAVQMIELLGVLKRYLAERGVERLIYKRVPEIYYSYPADEDVYALFRYGAQLFRRDISETIDLRNPIPMAQVRKRGAKKASKAGLIVKQTDDLDGYVSLLTEVLMTHHNARPPHTSSELRLLMSRFPEVIKLFCAYQDEKMLAGVLIFDTKFVVHAQYIANSEEGRKIGALDLVLDYLINEYSKGKRYFDFGICTENDGRLLNEGLSRQKEMFGGRGVIYDFYSLPIR